MIMYHEIIVCVTNTKTVFDKTSNGRKVNRSAWAFLASDSVCDWDWAEKNYTINLHFGCIHGYNQFTFCWYPKYLLLFIFLDTVDLHLGCIRTKNGMHIFYTAKVQIDCICILGYSRFAFWLCPPQTQTESQTESDAKRINDRTEDNEHW